MRIKTIPRSRLEADPMGVLTECADSRSIMLVELPDQRLVAIQSLDAPQYCDLIKKHLVSNRRFREMVARSKAGPLKPFPLVPNPDRNRGEVQILSFLSRYMDGEREQVWSDLLALEDEVRFASNFPHAYAVAKETMRRVRCNLEVLVDRLRKIGYQFAWPDFAYLPPDRRAREQIQEIEELLGPLPLSLRAFYEIVGSVDFRQSSDQLIQYDRPERATATEIELLGEEDPLVVAPLWQLAEAAASAGRMLYFCFAVDEFHKANYSGGENYHVWLPDPRADFEIVGMYGVDEHFVEYLRATFAGGGFRGRSALLEDDESRCRKVLPKLQVVRQLAEGLLPI